MNEMYVQHDLLNEFEDSKKPATSSLSAVTSIKTASPIAHSINSRTSCEAAQKASEQEACVEANVTEIIIARNKADNVQLLLPMLTHLNKENRWLAWIDPPMELLRKWRSESGTDGSDIMVLRSSKDIDATNIAQRALAAGTCHAVIMWTQGLGNDSFDMLEQASAQGDSHCIVLRNR